MKLREIYRSPQYYSVCESDRTARLVLSVVVGGIMMYPVVVELTEEEEAEFERDGELDRLANDVSRNRSKYSERILKPRSKEEELEFVDVIEPPLAPIGWRRR